jgi:hypothetical protein
MKGKEEGSARMTILSTRMTTMEEEKRREVTV